MMIAFHQEFYFPEISYNFQEPFSYPVGQLIFWSNLNTVSFIQTQMTQKTGQYFFLQRKAVVNGSLLKEQNFANGHYKPKNLYNCWFQSVIATFGRSTFWSALSI